MRDLPEPPVRQWQHHANLSPLEIIVWRIDEAWYASRPRHPCESLRLLLRLLLLLLLLLLSL
jgi:hypothetical protein